MGKVAVQKSTSGQINPNLKSCKATCAGKESTPVAPPAKLEHTFDALIDLNDPTTFTMNNFIDAVKSVTGVSEVPTAVVKAFEILVQYTVPHAAADAQIKTAVAAVNSV